MILKNQVNHTSSRISWTSKIKPQFFWQLKVENQQNNVEFWISKLTFGLFLSLFALLFSSLQFGFPSQARHLLMATALIALISQVFLGLTIYPFVFHHFRTQKNKILASFAAFISFALSLYVLFSNISLTASAYSPFLLSPLILTCLSFLMFQEEKYLSEILERSTYLETLRIEIAHKLTSQGEIQNTTTRDLKTGDQFWVYAGEKIPRDGVILKGTTSVDESALTGEFRPLLKEKGEPVIGGSLNRDSDILIEITHEQKDDILEQMIQKTQRNLDTQAPLHLHIAKVSTSLNNFLVFLALLCILYLHFFRQLPFYESLVFALTVLLAAPLSLEILTEISFNGFLGSALHKGIVFSKNISIDTLANIQSLFFNKTGTLTLGDFVYSQSFIESGTNMGECLTSVFSIEKKSQHPLAEAMETHPWYVEIPKFETDKEEYHQGLGVYGKIKPRGGKEYDVAVGNLRFVKRMRFHISRDMKAKMDDLEEMGETIVLCGYKKQVRGILSFSDTLRKGVKSTLKKIQKLGIETALMTGDTEKTVTQLTGNIGIKKVYSRCTPQEKASKIKKEQEQGRKVAIVESDINESAAFQASDLSLAIDTGTQISHHPADVLILGSNFELLHWLFEKAHRCYKMIQVAKYGAIILSLLLTAGAFFGLFSPYFALSISFLWAVTTLYFTYKNS